MASVLSRQNKAFIEANPIQVELQRWKKVTTTAGGFTLVKDDLLLEQLGRLVHGSGKTERVSRTLPDGRVVLEEATLVMESDADIKVGDTFEAEEKEWLVGTVFRTIHESVNARVGARG